MNEFDLTPSEREELNEIMKGISPNVDAVFLPGKVHGATHQVYIIYLNPDANEGSGCFEIEPVDSERVLKTYEDANGVSDRFWGLLPDRFNGEWMYADYGTRDFYDCARMFHQADLLTKGGGEEEMLFLVNWANLYEKCVKEGWHSNYCDDPIRYPEKGSAVWALRRSHEYDIANVWHCRHDPLPPVIMHGKYVQTADGSFFAPLKKDGTIGKARYNSRLYDYFLTEGAAQRAHTLYTRRLYNDFIVNMDRYLKERDVAWKK